MGRLLQKPAGDQPAPAYEAQAGFIVEKQASLAHGGESLRNYRNRLDPLMNRRFHAKFGDQYHLQRWISVAAFRGNGASTSSAVCLDRG